MIEKVILDYLYANLSDDQSIFVGFEPPQEQNGYVLLEKTGSSITNHISTSTFAVQSYGATMYEAMLLNEKVKSVMDGLLSLDQITRVELETDYNFTDTTTKQYRMQAVYDITHY